LKKHSILSVAHIPANHCFRPSFKSQPLCVSPHFADIELDMETITAALSMNLEDTNPP
jgi:hypothetical protein